jgi:hypothetical protein
MTTIVRLSPPVALAAPEGSLTNEHGKAVRVVGLPLSPQVRDVIIEHGDIPESLRSALQADRSGVPARGSAEGDR